MKCTNLKSLHVVSEHGQLHWSHAPVLRDEVLVSHGDEHAETRDAVGPYSQERVAGKRNERLRELHLLVVECQLMNHCCLMGKRQNANGLSC